jgi:hypothetical protein
MLQKKDADAVEELTAKDFFTFLFILALRDRRKTLNRLIDHFGSLVVNVLKTFVTAESCFGVSCYQC